MAIKESEFRVVILLNIFLFVLTNTLNCKGEICSFKYYKGNRGIMRPIILFFDAYHRPTF